jgi:hypothetical protein
VKIPTMSLTAGTDADMQAEQMQHLCKWLKLPLTSLEFTPPPAQMDSLPPGIEAVLSNMLASAEAAATSSSPVLASDALGHSAFLVCGSDLCSAEFSTLAEHVAEKLATHVPLTPVQLSEPFSPKKAARDALLPVNDVSAAWETANGRLHDGACESTSHSQTAKLWQAVMSVSAERVSCMSMRTFYSAASCMRSTVNADLALRLSATLVAAEGCAQPALQDLMVHSATSHIVQKLGLPPLPPAMLKVPTKRVGRSAATSKKQQARSSEGSAAMRLATWAKEALPQCIGHPYASQLLYVFACSAFRQGVTRKSFAAHEDAPAVCMLLLLSMHVAQSCVPVLDQVCRHVAAATVQLGCPAVACAVLERGLGAANQHASLLPLLLVAPSLKEQPLNSSANGANTSPDPQAHGRMRPCPSGQGSRGRQVQGIGKHGDSGDRVDRHEGHCDHSGSQSVAACMRHAFEGASLDFLGKDPLDAAIAALDHGAPLRISTSFVQCSGSTCNTYLGFTHSIGHKGCPRDAVHQSAQRPCKRFIFSYSKHLCCSLLSITCPGQVTV